MIQILADTTSQITLPAVLYILMAIGLGLAIGEIPFPGGFKLGVAGVLFSGLILGAIMPQQKIPGVLQEFGLVLFVYGIGLQTGPGFFRSFRKDGLKINVIIAISLLAAFGLCAAYIFVAKRDALAITGLFCGSLTSTPALGAATETLANSAGPDKVNSIVVGYAIIYPFAITCILLIVQCGVWLGRKRQEASAVSPGLHVRTIEMTTASGGKVFSVRELESTFHVRVTRLRLDDDETKIQHEDDLLPPGTLVSVVGTQAHLAKLLETTGKPSDLKLNADSASLVVIDLHVSNHRICGRPIGELETRLQGMVISRVRRGDVEMAASPVFQLQPGDEVRVVAERARVPEIKILFGNSTTALSERFYFTYVAGIVLGLLVGMIPIPVPGLSTPLYLGMAGGPLVAGIILGWIGRTGPLVWSMPYEINMGLRHFGLLIFLAAVGANAGASLLPALESEGPILILFGIIIIFLTHAMAWLIMKINGEHDIASILGILSGLQTQPAALSFAAAKVEASKVQLGYATVFPLATILKIILAQLLLEMAR